MRRFSVCAVTLLVLLLALIAAQQPIQASTAPGNSLPTSVAGTIWVGADSDGDYYEYHFQADGALHYKSPDGFHKNATWTQDGDAIYMETNKKFSEREGRISGTHMEGKARNVRGDAWTWAADKR